METQSSLVGADGAVELHPIADVDMDFSFVIYPGYTEGDDTFGLHDALDNLCLLKLGMLVVYILY